MSYNTLSQFLLRAFPSGSFNDLDENVITDTLSAAANEIDASLRIKHTLPMVSSSYGNELAILEDAERVITSYRLMLYRGFRPNIDGDVDNVLLARYSEVVGENGLLERIQDGRYRFADSSDQTTIKEGRPRFIASAQGASDQGRFVLGSDGKRYVR